MNAKGFTLLEMLIVLVITGVLLAIGTVSFNTWRAKARVESQVRTLYADLMEVRSQAFYQKRTRSVLVSATQYAVYSSAATSVTPLKVTTFTYPVNTNPGSLRIDWDGSGVATFNSDPSIGDAEICTQTSPTNAVFTSIVAYQTRVQMGSFITGTGCNNANIAAQ
jgi:prepilin-type N-terminal cleavage/methylation domain-containing protein